MELHFDTSELEKMGRNYAGGPQIVREETVRAMTRSVVAIEADAKRRVPTDTHNLQRSITHEVETGQEGIVGRAGTNVEYAEAVEFGRRAGAAPPPSNALLGWMRRKGIDESLAFVIARSIGRKGIAPRPYMKPGYDVNKLKINRELGPVLMKRVMTRIGSGRG